MLNLCCLAESVGDETAEWHQSFDFDYDYDYLQMIKSSRSRGIYVSSIFENVPRRCRSKRLIQKKHAKVLDSGKGIIQLLLEPLVLNSLK